MEWWWPIVHSHGNVVQQTQWDVPVREREHFTQEASRRIDALCIGAPVRESIRRILADHVEAFTTADIPIATLLDLGKDPRLDQSATRNHSAVHMGMLQVVVIVAPAIHVSVAIHRHRHHVGLVRMLWLLIPRTHSVMQRVDAGAYVPPVGIVLVPLLA